MPSGRVVMSAAGIEQALVEARALRELAAGITLHSTGSAWRSPARDRCDVRLDDLERQAQVIARKLELWAENEGAASLRVEHL